MFFILVLIVGHDSKIFPNQSVESFHASVRAFLIEQMEGLDYSAMLKVKQLIQAGVNDKNSKDATNLRESYAQAERFSTGIPQQRFLLVSQKKLKHKL